MEPIHEIIPKLDPELKAILDEFHQLISEAVNFGTHLLNWDVQFPRPGKDNHIPSIFLRNIIDISDAISTLVQNSSVDPAKILLRSLLESCYALMYMIEKDEEKRSKCFIVFRTVEKIKNINKWIEGEESHKEFIKRLSTDEVELDFSNWINHPEFTSTKESQETLLEKPEFQNVYKEYLRTKKVYNHRRFNWYSLYEGPSSFLKLAEYLKKSLRYEFFYRSFSDNVHGTSVMKGLAPAGKNRAQIIQIRDYENAQEVTSNTITLLIELYTFYTDNRLPSKKNKFRQWYTSFRKPYQDLMGRNRINYKK